MLLPLWRAVAVIGGKISLNHLMWLGLHFEEQGIEIS